MSEMLWFQHCAVYLNRLEALDAYFELYDTMPMVTKEDREQKRITFDGLMRTLKEKKEIEQDLEDLWGCDAGYPNVGKTI